MRKLLLALLLIPTLSWGQFLWTRPQGAPSAIDGTVIGGTTPAAATFTTATATNRFNLSTDISYPGAGLYGVWRQSNLGTVLQGSGTLADITFVDRNGAGGVQVLQGGDILMGSGGKTAGLHMRGQQQTAPTCTTNCGASPSVSGTDIAGVITLGTTPASAFQLNFNASWANAGPSCIVQSALATMVVGKMPIAVVTTVSTMVVTTNGTAPSTGDKYQYHCIGVS